MNKKDLINHNEIEMDYRFITYDEWNKRVKESLGEDFKLIDLWFGFRKDRKGREAILEIKHNICNKTFFRKGNNVKHTKYCTHCTSLLQASHLHHIFCILANYFYPNSETEKDIWFKGNNGGHSKYDLYIPKYKNKKTLFEFQSKYHDNKKDFDKRKKNFAIKNGYEIIIIDHRDKDIEKVCRKYFPINKIPNFVFEELYSINKKIPFKKIQKMLDIPMSIVDISEDLNISASILYHHINIGTLKKNENHDKIIYNKKKVVMMDLKGNFIDKFNSYYEILKKHNIKVDSIREGKMIRREDNLFCLYEDYINNNYKIPKKLNIQYKIKQTDKDGNLINIYNSQNEVCRLNDFDIASINKAINGIYKQAYGYKWDRIID